MKRILRRLENEMVNEEVQEEVEEVQKEEMNEQQMPEGKYMELLMEEINSKTLNIVGSFDEKMVAYVRDFANSLWYYEEDPLKPLFINISSHGGYASALLAILDILDDLKEEWGCKIITNCNGYAESCGFILWCTGEERYMGKYGELMCHEVAYHYEDKVSGHEQELQRTKKLQKKVDKIIMEKTGLTQKQLNKWYKSGYDKFIDREEALKLGILTLEEEEKDEDKE